ncbi:MAG: ScpA family protein [Pirellulales bacterium]
MRFSVQLDDFRGPMDLLVYLVRKHELAVVDLPLARIIDQYLEFIAVLEQIDVDAVGDFLDMASSLIEIKSRMVLPGEEEVVEELEDPRRDLVRRLLEFKQYRDAASMLEERSREWRERFPRVAIDAPPRTLEPHEQPIREVELWDLVSAFGRVLKQKLAATGPTHIRYDDTPIHVFMQRIDARLRDAGRMAFVDLFDAAVHKSTLIGMFLAVLQLMRYQHARAAQSEVFEEIWLEVGASPLPAEFTGVDEFEHGAAPA